MTADLKHDIETMRVNADRIAAQIMERIEHGGITTRADAMWIAELLGRPDVEQSLFRWFNTKGD